MLIIFLAPTLLLSQTKPSPDASFFEWDDYFTQVINNQNQNQSQPGQGEEDGIESNYGRWYRYWMHRLEPDGKMSSLSETTIDLIEGNLQLCNTDEDQHINWENLGPFNSDGSSKTNQGRIDAISVDPTDTMKIVIGAYNGGVWKTTNGGKNWSNVTDDDGLSMVGITHIIRHPADPQIMFAGTTTELGPHFTHNETRQKGVGVIMSRDGGSSWNLTGLHSRPLGTNLIHDIEIDPRSTLQNTILYAVDTWTLFKYSGNLNTDTYLSYSNWQQLEEGTSEDNYSYYLDLAIESTGKVWVVGHEGYYTYEPINSLSVVEEFDMPYPDKYVAGFPQTCSNCTFPYRINSDVKINKNDQIVIASKYLFQDPSNKYKHTRTFIFQSDNSGANWEGNDFVPTGEVDMMYECNFEINEYNSNRFYFDNGDRGISRSLDGGKDAGSGPPFSSRDDSLRVASGYGCKDDCIIHVDQRTFHVISTIGIDSLDIVYVGNDGGIAMSTDGGETWKDKTGEGLAITNYFGFGISEDIPNYILGGAQDGSINEYDNGVWKETSPGGDNGDCAIQYGDPTYYYQSWQKGLTRHKKSSNGNFTSGKSAYLSKRGTQPKFLNPSIPNELFFGQVDLYVISPEFNLSRIVPEDQNGNRIHPDKKVWSVAMSKVNPDVVYYSIEGYYWDITENGDHENNRGGIYKATRSNNTWTVEDVTSNLNQTKTVTGKTTPGLKAAISDIVVDPYDETRIWVTLSGYGNNGESIYYTENGGSVWNPVGECFPNIPATSIQYQEGTADRLYVGSEIGVFYTEIGLDENNNGTQEWVYYGNYGPKTLVSDMEIDHCDNKLVVSTLGRGMWRAPLLGKTAHDISLATGDIDWNDDRRIMQDVYVQAGTNLDINNARIEFDEGVSMHVLPGGNVFVNNSTLSAMCGDTWDGVYVYGEVGSTTYTEGEILVYNSTVEHAENGITFVVDGDTDVKVNGVNCKNSSFFNNKKSLTFISTRAPINGSRQNIENSTFDITEDYRFEEQWKEHVELTGINRIPFIGCSFLNNSGSLTHSDKSGIGINAFSTSFRVIPLPGATIGSPVLKRTKFEHLNRGIYARGAHDISPFEVKEADFHNNYTGIRTSLVNYFSVKDCDFIIGYDNNPESLKAHVGINSEACTGYTIERNSFTPAFSTFSPVTFGISMRNSGSDGNYITENTFSTNSSNQLNGFKANIACGNNRHQSNVFKGLNYDCNHNDNGINSYDFTVYGLGVSQFQGDFQKSAMNHFTKGTISGGYKPGSDFFNGGEGITYFSAVDDLGAILPDYNPENVQGDILPYFSDQKNCSLATTTDGPIISEVMLFQKFSHLDSLQQVKDQLLDNWSYSTLTQSIVGATFGNVNSIKNSVNQSDPYLSQSAAMALIAQHFLFGNSYVSTTIQNNPYLVILPIIKKELISQNVMTDNQFQLMYASNTLTDARSSLEFEIGDALRDKNTDYYTYLNKLLIDSISQETAVLNILSDENSINSHITSLNHYLANGQQALANMEVSWLQNQVHNGNMSIADSTELKEFVSLKELQLSHINSLYQKTPYSSSVEALLLSMESSSGKAEALSTNLLYQYFDTEIDEYFCNLINDNGGDEAQPRIRDELPELDYLTVFPNPSSGNINAVIDKENISCDLDKRISCYNIRGKEVLSKEFNRNKEVITLNLKGKPSGTYLIVLYCGDNLLQSQKIIIE